MRVPRPRVSRRRGLALGLIAMLALVVPAATLAAPAIPGRTVDLQILDVSDWHGQVDPINGVGGAPVL